MKIWAIGESGQIELLKSDLKASKWFVFNEEDQKTVQGASFITATLSLKEFNQIQITLVSSNGSITLPWLHNISINTMLDSSIVQIRGQDYDIFT